MKSLKIWRITLIMLAAVSLASCNSDDDEIPSEDYTFRALAEMKNPYIGQLKYGLKDEGTRQTIDNVVAESAEELLLEIPLEPIAAQVQDEAVAKQLREWKTAKVRATYNFNNIEDEYFSFGLRTELVPDERYARPFTRTSFAEYEGLQLLFSQDYTGEYQKPNEALSFNICVDKVLINQEPLEDFKPVIFRYEGVKTSIMPSVWKSTCQIRYSLFGVSEDFLRFYDVNVEYLDVNGQMQSETIKNPTWVYEPAPVSFVSAPDEFKCRIFALRKSDTPELTDDYYEIGYGINTHVRFLDAEGNEFYSAKHTEPSSYTWGTDKAGMQQFLETPEIVIENFSLNLNKDDMISSYHFFI